MFKIGEFSRLTQVSVRMLRYYDEVGLFRPACVDRFTGYRLYTVEQIRVLNKIIFLRDTGFTVSEIAAFLNEPEGTAVLDQLEQKQKDIGAVILLQQNKLARIQTAIKEIGQKKPPISYNMTLKSIPSYHVLSLRKIIPDYFDEGQLWQELGVFVKQTKAPLSLNEMNIAIYHDVEYKDREVDVEVCAMVDRLGTSCGEFTYRKTDAVLTMACTMVTGPFENIAGAYYAFAEWLQQNEHYKMAGANRQICHRGPWNEETPERYLTEIQIPVEEI